MSSETTRENIRSKSWKSQPAYDVFLSDTDMSGLRFLKTKYERDLWDYQLDHDLNNPKNFEEYKEIQQRYKMICEELEKRYHDTLLLDEDDVHFSENYEYIVNESKDGKREIWSVDLYEDEPKIKVRKIGNVKDSDY